MPIPILVLFGFGVVTTGAGAALNVRAKKRINQAKQKYTDRRKRYEQVIREYEEKRHDAASRFEDLGRTRLKAVGTLGKAAEFLGQAKLKERELFEKFNITPEQLIQFKKVSVSAREVLAGGASAVGSGIATAAAAYGLVGTLASASTGTAIATLSGAAAKSATLAWLGGGTLVAGGGGMAAGTMVLGGLFVGPVILVMGFKGLKRAADVERQVEEHIAKLDIDGAKKRRLAAALDAVIARVAEVKEATIKLTTELDNLLSSSSPDNDHDAYQVAKAAVSLEQLLDIRILDEEGRII